MKTYNQLIEEISLTEAYKPKLIRLDSMPKHIRGLKSIFNKDQRHTHTFLVEGNMFIIYMTERDGGYNLTFDHAGYENNTPLKGLSMIKIFHTIADMTYTLMKDNPKKRKLWFYPINKKLKVAYEGIINIMKKRGFIKKVWKIPFDAENGKWFTLRYVVTVVLPK